jgi:hypothetical protein
MYTIEQMMLAYDAGKEKKDFKEFIGELEIYTRCAACHKQVETHPLCINCVTQMIENDY